MSELTGDGASRNTSARLRTAATHIPAVAADIMSTPVFTVPASASVEEIAGVLGRHQISAVPVVDESGHVLGVVSEYDVLAKPGRTASEVMSAGVVSISPDTRISDIRSLLVDQRMGRLPVLEAGRLAGIVSRRDVVALLTTEWACGICGEPTRALDPPENCPTCGGTGTFKLQEQPPGP
ncbi:CBS domain-containing protein [Arthrobacter roseus]|uniref:CBS domain-containing protein n=1 Tax=Arthrobacter roseus TaxID=136274 RepID=UPI001965550F|nr:CBS domain-containing protein [Arthrobacter roseus]MBM7847525.1 CBS domain-containing protein [Arthrobacter roseus]